MSHIIKNICLFAFAILAMNVLTGCDDQSTDTFGVSLLDRSDNVTITNATFKASSRSVKADAIWARSSTGYLGKVKDPETGGYVTGSFMSQFHALEDFEMVEESIITSREDGLIIADSCEVRLFFTSFFGDSLATMKLTAHELDHPMKENQHYTSSFDPVAEGYTREGGIKKSRSYTLVNYPDGTQRFDDNYVKNICVPLNEPYTSKEGVTYNNFGTYILRTYYAHPEYFKNSISMMEHVLPGFYFEYSGGVGSMAYIITPQLNIYFRTTKDSKESNQILLFSGTQEVLQTTKITNDDNTIESLVNDPTCTYLKTPSGIFTELTLPINEMMSGHENDTINQVKISIPRINSAMQNEWLLSAPSYVLMVHADSVSTFFDNEQLSDNKYSFLSSFSNKTNSYTFSNICTLVSRIAALRESGLKSDSEWESRHPNWNRVMLIPVSAEFKNQTSYGGTTTTTLIHLTHDLSLGSTRLIGGDSALELQVIYSKFK
ncbi:MAG: DUF4270 domain-containing protein [Prevotella sp.]|nr:DUF4270 domain-containing protein [Prevotella sp.]